MGHIKERKGDRQPDPILKLRQARLAAKKVIERDASERDDGSVYAPQASILWKILDDGKNGEHTGVEFWDKYSFVKSFEDDKKYVIREDTRIGDLAAFVAYEFYNGADYFDDDVDIEFEELEGAEVVAQLEPRQFKDQAPTGTRTVSKTLMLADKAQKVKVEHKTFEKPDNAGAAWVSDEISVRPNQQAATAAKEARSEAVDESGFEDLPF